MASSCKQRKSRRHDCHLFEVYPSMPLHVKKGEEKSYVTGPGEFYHPEYRTAVWVLIMSFHSVSPQSVLC